MIISHIISHTLEIKISRSHWVKCTAWYIRGRIFKIYKKNHLQLRPIGTPYLWFQERRIFIRTAFIIFKWPSTDETYFIQLLVHANALTRLQFPDALDQV